MQSPEEIEARVEVLTSPEASPEQPVSDPTRRWTEIYMKGADLKEHIKLRDDADSNLRQIEKIRQEETELPNEAKTAEKVNELIAADAATQAAMAAISMAADNTSIKTLLTQPLQLQAKQNSTEATATVTETEHYAE